MVTSAPRPPPYPVPVNVEFKARHPDPEGLLPALEALGATLHGVDRQQDTYFHAPQGRLKLREGTVEVHLIHYERPDQAGPSRSDVALYRPEDAPALRAVLTAALGVRLVVAKTRHIYYAGNVKIHLDAVDGLGTFIEVEAIDADGSRTEADLLAQCSRFMLALGVADTDLEPRSYSDLLGTLPPSAHAPHTRT